MAGVTQIQGGTRTRAGQALFVLLAALLLAVVLFAGRAAAPAPARAQLSCPPFPTGLSPFGPGSTRFTMMIRINTQGNVDTYTKPQLGMGDRIRPQDIFVLNTRFQGSSQFSPMTPTEAANLALQLHNTFPCNRIISLNGLSYDPAAAGYAFTSIDDPNVYALMSDFEQGDWNAGRTLDPGRPPWNDDFAKAFPRIKAWNFGMAATAAGNPIGAVKRTGLVPQDLAGWNYGQIAQDLNKKNSRLGAPKLGLQTVQTQDACADGGAGGFGARAKNLRLQYTFKFITKKVKVVKKGKVKKVKKTIRLPLKKQGKPGLSNLGMEISFTDTPDVTASQAILSTSAAQAASCVGPALKQGMGAFFFFASDDAMRLLFQQPQIAALRPPAAATSANTGGVGPG